VNGWRVSGFELCCTYTYTYIYTYTYAHSNATQPTSPSSRTFLSYLPYFTLPLLPRPPPPNLALTYHILSLFLKAALSRASLAHMSSVNSISLSLSSAWGGKGRGVVGGCWGVFGSWVVWQLGCWCWGLLDSWIVGLWGCWAVGLLLGCW